MSGKNSVFLIVGVELGAAMSVLLKLRIYSFISASYKADATETVIIWFPGIKGLQHIEKKPFAIIYITFSDFFLDSFTRQHA